MKKKNLFNSFPGVIWRGFHIALLSVFLTQSSAYSFSAGIPFGPNSPASSVIQPVNEMETVGSRGFLSQAISPIQTNSSILYSSIEASVSPVVSVYSYENRYRKFTRLVFAAKNSETGYPYQAYEIDSSNRLGRLIETGKMLNGDFVRERIYDYKNKTVTLYDFKNMFEKRIYELTENGEVGRPFQFSGRTPAGDLVNIRFIYRGSFVICLHLRGMSYSIYSLMKDGQLGDLLEMGTAQDIDRDGHIISKSRVQISEIDRAGVKIPVYVFINSRGGALVRERRDAPGRELGGIGRILRYMNEDLDFEYFYDDSPISRTSSVKVVNHRLGQVFTFEVLKKDLKNPYGNLDKNQRAQSEGLAKAVASIAYAIGRIFPGVIYSPSENSRLPIYIRSNDQVLIWEKLLRGPPVFSRTVFNFVRGLFGCVKFPSQNFISVSSFSFFRGVWS